MYFDERTMAHESCNEIGRLENGTIFDLNRRSKSSHYYTGCPYPKSCSHKY